MALKGIEHYQGSHYYHHKGPPFDIKHQLMLSDLILIVKIGLKSAISFSFIFLLFLLIYTKSKIRKLGQNRSKLSKLFVSSLC